VAIDEEQVRGFLSEVFGVGCPGRAQAGRHCVELDGFREGRPGDAGGKPRDGPRPLHGDVPGREGPQIRNGPEGGTRKDAGAQRQAAAHLGGCLRGALHATVLGGDEEVPLTTGPTLQVLEDRFGITSSRAERAAQRRDAADALADQLEAGCVHVVLPHVALTVEGLEVPPLQAVSDKQLAYARAVRARAAHGFLGAMLARGAKLPRSNVEEQMPILAGWVQSHLRAETESRYWLDGQARAAPDIGVVGDAFRASTNREGGDARGPAASHRPGVAMSLTMISDHLAEQGRAKVAPRSLAATHCRMWPGRTHDAATEFWVGTGMASAYEVALVAAP